MARAKAKKTARHTLKQICEELLCMECPPGAEDPAVLLEAGRAAARERGRPLDLYEAALLAQVSKALQGNASAFVAVRDAAGDKTPEPEPAPATLTAADLTLLRKVARRLDEETKAKEQG